ncbi:MAG TPA: histidine phosphatase family protein [Acidimicrobiales bacterium]
MPADEQPAPYPQLPASYHDRFPTEIILVRHARSADVVPGTPEAFDPPLHPEGVAQAEALARRLRPKRIDAVYVSTLVRTAETAAPLAEPRGLEPVVLEGLREVFLGEGEGGVFRRWASEGGPVWDRFLASGRWDALPGAERDEDLRQRVVAAVDGIAATHEGGSVLVVSHGGAINAYLADVLGVERTQFTVIENSSVTLVRYGQGRRLLVTVNDVHHLYDPVLGALG